MFNEAHRVKEKMYDSASAQTAVNRVIHLQNGANFPLKLADNDGLRYVDLVQRGPTWRSVEMLRTQAAEPALYLLC